MRLNVSHHEINESALLIKIERFVLSSLDATRQPRSFYEDFSNYLLDFHQVYNPDFSYSCLITLFCSLLYDYDLERESSTSLYHRLNQRSFREWQNYFNQVRADHFNELSQHRYNESLNTDKLDNRLRELLSSYSALLVVRLDLSYVVNPDIEQVDADLEKLRRKISRSSYGDDLLLLVWALEQGERKGYHCHVALVFDERKRIGAWSIAKAIGKFWESITDGDGSYFNCHDPRYLKQYEKQGNIGIGVVFSNLHHQAKNMRSTLSYLAQPEKLQYLRVKTSSKMRTFGMSQR